MEIAAGILALAALGGATMVVMRLNGVERPPTWMALGHGAVAAAGVGTLIYFWLTTGVPLLAQVAVGLFVLAALGGIFIFTTYHLQELPLPIPLILGHGLIAIIALVLLVVAIFTRAGP